MPHAAWDVFGFKRGSERISYGEVDARAFPKLRDVVVAAFASVVRGVDSYTPVQAEDEKLQVVANTEACAQGNVFEKLRTGNLTARMTIVATHQPHITGIDEKGAIEIAHPAESVFGIEFQLEVTSLIKVGAFIIVVIITARTNRTDSECSDVVGTTYIELLGVRGYSGVAIAPNSTSEQTKGQLGMVRQVDVAT